MTVSRILEKKGSAVVTVDGTAPLQSVVDTLARNRFGVVVVTTPAGSIAGLISERDVIAALAAHGSSALAMAAQEVMTKSVATCSPDDPESEIMERMDAMGVRHLPVMAAGRLAGIVSLRDVIRLRIEKIDEVMATITRQAERMQA